MKSIKEPQTCATILEGDVCRPLTAAETELLKHFRNMDDRSQGFIANLAHDQAFDCPRRPRVPFRVIEGGAA